MKDDIYKEVKEFVGSYGNKEAECKNMWGAIAQRMADAQDACQRHTKDDLRAAKRIFNGAIRSGYYNLMDAREKQRTIMLYEKLIDNSLGEKDQEKEKETARDIILKAENELRSGVRELKSKPFAEIRRVLVIEDQKEMWEPVWNFIFGEEKIDIVSTGREALERLRNGSQYDCALVDIYLGDSQLSGLEVLRCFREIALELPILMMTAYEDFL
jgi:uncharacterized protein YukE